MFGSEGEGSRIGIAFKILIGSAFFVSAAAIAALMISDKIASPVALGVVAGRSLGNTDLYVQYSTVLCRQSIQK